MSAVPVGPGIDIWRSCRFSGLYSAVYGSVAWWAWAVSAL